MANNNTIAINDSDEKLRILVEEYITQQRKEFSFQGLCSYILYWAMEDSKTSDIYEGYQMTETDSKRVNHILEQIVREGRLVKAGDSQFKCSMV